MSELISVGVLGLIDAAGRYRPSLGVPFDAFARRRVQGAMLDALRELDWAPRSLRRMRRDIDGAIATAAAQLGREPDGRRDRRRDESVDRAEYEKALDQMRTLETRRGPSARRTGAGRHAAPRAVHRPAERAVRAARAHRAEAAAGRARFWSCPSANVRSWRSTTRRS